MTIEYLIDENVNPIYAQQLRRQPDIVVQVVGEPATPPKGTLDPEILIWCETYDSVLVTNNRSSMPVHLADHIVLFFSQYPILSNVGWAHLAPCQGGWEFLKINSSFLSYLCVLCASVVK